MEEGGNALFCLSTRDGQKTMDKSPGEGPGSLGRLFRCEGVKE